MRAVVKFDQRPFAVELRDVPEPAIGPRDVLLETKAAGVCGADIEMWEHKMSFPVRTPVILGHEFCGVVAKVGPEVRRFAEGERVVSETAAEICGACPACRTGRYNLCPARKGFGYGADGAFARFVRVPERCLHRIPEGLPFEHAALTEPACVAYNALVVNSDIRPGEPLLIIGPGPIGLLCLQVAKAAGASPVVVVGTGADAQRLAIARELGADLTLDADSDDPLDAVLELTAGFGVPLVADAAGNERALALALRAVAPGGQITKIGWGPQPVGLSLDPLVQKGARLQGVFSHTWRTWEAVLQLLAAGALRVGPLIGFRGPIDRWEEAFRLAAQRKIVKAVLSPT